MFPGIIGEAAVNWLQRLKRRKPGEQYYNFSNKIIRGVF